MSNCVGYSTDGSVVHGANLLLEHGHLVGVARRVGKGEEDLITGLGLSIVIVLHLVTTDAAGEVHILLLDGNALGVDGTEVGVLEKSNDVGFGSLLESLKGLGLETQLMVHVHGDVTDEALEGCTGQEHIDRLLVSLDLSKSDSTSLESAVSLIFHATLGGGGLLDSFG